MTTNGLRTTDLNRINDADNSGVNWTFLAAEGHPRGAPLHDQDDFVNARAYGVNGNDVTLLILAVNADQPRDQQLASVKTIVFSGGDDGSNYSSKKHIRLQMTGYRSQVEGEARALSPVTYSLLFARLVSHGHVLVY